MTILICTSDRHIREHGKEYRKKIKTLSVVERSQKSVLSCGEKENSGRWRRRNKILVMIGMSRTYVTRYKTTTAVDEIELAANVTVCRRSTASFASGSVDIFKMRTIKMLLAFLPDVAAKCRITVPITESQLTFVKSCYMKGDIFQ